jgi:hypothetical protein
VAALKSLIRAKLDRHSMGAVYICSVDYKTGQSHSITTQGIGHIMKILNTADYFPVAAN